MTATDTMTDFPDDQAASLRAMVAEQTPPTAYPDDQTGSLAWHPVELPPAESPAPPAGPGPLARLKAAVARGWAWVRSAGEPPRPPMTPDERAAHIAIINEMIEQSATADMRCGFNRYQRRAMRTAVYPDQGTEKGLNYVVVGLSAESGELLNKWKKVLRGDRTPADARDDMFRELAGVLWYAAAVANELEAGLGDVAAYSLENLAGRQQRGTIRGDGDNR